MSLRGKVIALTRPEDQTHEVAELVSRMGGIPYIAPTVEIRLVQDIGRVSEFIKMIRQGKIDLVIFMSVNGVRGLVKAWANNHPLAELVELLNKTTVIAVGPKTRSELEAHGVKVSLTPLQYSAEGILASLGETELKGRTVAIPRRTAPDPYLRRRFESLGAKVIEVAVYESTSPSDQSRVIGLIDDLLNGRVDVITFTSPSTAQNLFEVAGKRGVSERLRDRLDRGITVAAIGPTTRKALEDLGVTVHIMPPEFTVDAVMEALVQWMERSAVLKTERSSVAWKEKR